MSKKSDVAFAMEGSFQNNNQVTDFVIAKSEQKASRNALKIVPQPRVVDIKPKFLPLVAVKPKKIVKTKFSPVKEKKSDISQWVKYSIKKGDSLSDIAKLFGAKASAIKVANNLKNENNIKAGQTISVPMPNSNLTYTVKPGDSLSKIAAKFRVSLKSLIATNKIKSHVLIANQKIKIPLKIKTEKLKMVKNSLQVARPSKKKFTLVKSKKMKLVPSKRLQMVKLRRIQIAQASAVKPKISFLDKKLLKQPPIVAKKRIQKAKPVKLVKETHAIKIAKAVKIKASKKATNTKSLYRVKKGDSLSRIAKRFKTTIAQIQSDNKLSNSKIKYNQLLKISPNKKLFKVTAKKVAKKSKSKIVKYRVRKGECLSLIARKFATNISSIVSANKLTSTIVKAGQKLKIPTGKRYKVSSSKKRRRAFAMRLPVRGRLSSPYGWRRHPVLKRRLFHAGIDIAARRGTSIKAAASGKVIFSGYRRGYGKVVIIRHRNGYSTRYGHCSRLLVRTGQKVRAGRLIARVGATGVATGNHVHFEIRKNGKTINPLKMVRMK